MGVKNIIYGEDVRRGILRGVETMARAVGVTLGPKGQNVVIEKPGLSPTITFDGVTVAKETNLSNQWEDIGVRLCKEVAGHTNEVSGDGTTTATLLAYSLLREGMKEITAGHPALHVRQGMELAREIVVGNLFENSNQVSSYSDIVSVARVACENQEMAEVVAEGMSEVGRDGIITVEDGQKVETYMENTSGMELAQTGYEAPEFINQDDATCVLNDPMIFCLDGILDSPQVVANLLTECVELERRSILFLADSFGQDAMATLLRNLGDLRARVGGIDYCAVKTPLVGLKRKDILEDIAVLTGSQVCSQNKGDNPLKWKLDQCGSCAKVKIWKNRIEIMGGDGSDGAIEQRVARIRYEIETSPSEYDSQKLRERLGRLVGGMTIIRVGAHTEQEMREKKRRLEDALSAVRASIEEGVVPGGGVALFHAARLLPRGPQDLLEDPYWEGKTDLLPGLRAAKRAAEAPLRAICENSGYEAGEVIGPLRDPDDWDVGFDVTDGTYKNFLLEGIVDPTKVVRCAWENAVSFAVTVLMTAVAISEQDPEAARMEAKEI